jgi:L-seryl-tRNA(Ser) seleniumtransferase
MPPGNRLRQLPSVERVLTAPAAAALLARFRRAYVVDAVRAELATARLRLAAHDGVSAPSADDVLAAVSAHLRTAAELPLRPVVNATGVILHTNLGRALLAEAALDAVARVASRPANLEYDLARGARGERDDLVAEDLRALTGAEAATVVNNNAAAVLLALNTLAEGREVIASRGELIEIGGSFRIPDVMTKSAAVLREVGTTNRTHPDDYRDAISDRTALLLKVHTSNYRIVGFTSDVPLDALVTLGRERGVPVMEDLGSGALVDLSAYGLPKEPVVAERIGLGADLVTFSGDKLLGGPQAGLIVGRRALIERIRRNPLKRALRCDKLTLAALAATLRLYRTAPDLPSALPTLRWLTRPLAEMDAVGRDAIRLLRTALGTDYEMEIVDSTAEAGSGALPASPLPSKALGITHPTVGANEIERHFRGADPPILGRVRDGRFLLDLRGIFCAEDLVPAVRP